MKPNSTPISLNSTKVSIENCKTLLDLNRDSITIFRISDDGVISNFIEANLATTELFGYTRAELLSLSILTLNLFSNKDLIKTLQTQDKISFTTNITTKLGINKTIEIESFLINYDNQPSFINVIRDVTESKQLEKNISKAYENLTTILEAIPDLLFEVDIESRIYYYQVSRNDLIPQHSNDFSGKLFSDVYPADVANVILEAIEEADINGWSTGKQYSLELPNGKKWFDLSVSLIKESSEKANHFILLARDITDQKIADEKLQNEKERIKIILELVGSPIFLKDKNHNITYANSAFCKLFSLDIKNIIGKSLVENVPENEKEHFLKIDKNVLDTGIPDIREEELTVEGHVHTIITSKTRFIDDAGNKMLIGAIYDITDRKKAEDLLQKSQEKLRGVFDLANSGIILTDLNGKYLLFNNWCTQALGYTRSELNKLNRDQITHPDDIEKSNDFFNKIITGKIDQYQFEKRFVRKDKSFFWAEVSTSAIKNKQNKVVNTIGIISDITERKKAEAKLISSEKFLNQTQIIANLGSFFLDFKTEKWTSTAVLDFIFGIDENFEKTVSSWISIIHPEWKKEMDDYLINEVIGKKANFNKEYKIIKINTKEERWVHGMGEIIFDKEGQLLHLIGSIQDITERKKTDDKLKLASEKFQDLVNSTGGIVWEADATTFNFNYVSQEAERLLGYPIEDWYKEGFWGNHLHPDDKEGTIKFCISQTKQMKDHDFTYRFRAKKGNYVWLRDIVTVVPENGKPKWLRGVMFDISYQKITEQLLQESEEKYRGLVENSPDAIVIYVDEKIVFINNEGLKMLDTNDKTEIIGKSVLQFVHPDHIPSVMQRMDDVTKDNNISTFVEERFITVKGIPFDVELKAIPIIFEQKSGVQVIVHNITKRKQVETELNKINRVYALISQINNLILRTHNKEELFQEICNIAVNIGKFRMSWIGILSDDNQTVNTSAFAGFEDGYFTKEAFSIILESPDGKGPTGTAIRERKTMICNDIANDPMMMHWRNGAVERGYRSSISIPITVRNKTIGCFNLYSDETNFFTSEEEITLLEKIVLNISFTLETILIEEDRKHTEVKIRQLSQAVEQSPVTIVITNPKGEIEYVNPKFTETTGYSIEEIIGQNPKVLKSGHTSAEEYKDLWKTINQGKDWHGEFHNKKKDGTLYWESASVSPIVNEQGITTHYIAIKEDITERKNVEKELIKAKENAEESDRLKLAFLANMSHEIRTPMNGILGFTELLKEPKLSGEEQKEYIEIIEKSGKRMLNIINDIINISKIESGQIEVSLSETNVNEQIDYLNTFFKPETKQKGIQLLVTKKLIIEDCHVLTDREKLYAVLTNLIKNAIKFTNEGSIEFGCEKKNNYLHFFVKDTGLGISKTQQNIIFERFRQANESLTRSHEGSGLGLAISKAYIEMLGGKIWVESDLGKGSTFHFTIPYQTKFIQKEKINISKKDSGTKKENKIKNLKVLIVEDDPISKLLITIALKPYSKEIIKVGTGLEAIDACRNNPDIDLVMMDINMPEMGGYEATNKIREFNKKLVIIAQTANGMQSDREDAIAAGCTDYISKPININSLSVLIKKYFKK
jgi:PAS domain S-box-containing protein